MGPPPVGGKKVDPRESAKLFNASQAPDGYVPGIGRGGTYMGKEVTPAMASSAAAGPSGGAGRGAGPAPAGRGKRKKVCVCVCVRVYAG